MQIRDRWRGSRPRLPPPPPPPPPAAAPTPTLPRKRGREQKAPHLAKSISSLTGAMWIALDSLRSIAPSPACGGRELYRSLSRLRGRVGVGVPPAAVCPGVRRDD